MRATPIPVRRAELYSTGILRIHRPIAKSAPRRQFLGLEYVPTHYVAGTGLLFLRGGIFIRERLDGGALLSIP